MATMKEVLRKLCLPLALVTLATGLSANAVAATKEIGSCYNAVKLNDMAVPALKREIYVVVDQTVEFDLPLQEQAYQKLMKFLRPGDRVVLVSFSAYLKDRYTQVLFDGTLDTRLDDEQRYDVPKKILKVLDHCFSVQDQGVRQLTGKTLIEIFKGARSDLPNTETIQTLRLVANQLMSKPKAPQQYLFIISDMLEHSEVTSFYSHGSVRHLDPQAELEKVKKLGPLGDSYNDTKVYVLGAAYSLKGRYRSSVEMKSVRAFWQAYFDASGGHLIEFGMPALLGEIGE